MKTISVREIRKELTQIDQRGRCRHTLICDADLRASMPRLKKGSEKLVRGDRDER